MSKIAFITGITGQDGSYLSELLLDKEYKKLKFLELLHDMRLNVALKSQNYRICQINIRFLRLKLIVRKWYNWMAWAIGRMFCSLI